MNVIVRRAALGGLLVLTCAGAARAADAEGSTRDTEWHGYNGGHDATRFSPLEQINTTNVADLNEVGRYEIPETMGWGLAVASSEGDR